MPDEPKKNRIGLTIDDYRGSKSTLCMGCGHDTITNQIITAFYDMGVDPLNTVKFSGIGCSSKTPAYFMGKTQGFNSVHGRMPSVATGALVANRSIQGIAVSGDGDTANIGLGQFCHVVRRNLPMLYIVENNGVYGLTKGQFSATADRNSTIKSGASNPFQPIDLCQLAMDLGCTYVARSFAGDMPQVLTLLKGALSHKGLAFIDIISPCVTFNNHDTSTKSYKWAKDHEEMLHMMDYIPSFAPITLEMKEGEAKKVQLHDGSHLLLRKLKRDYDPTDKIQAMNLLEEARMKDEFLTGLLYVKKTDSDFRDTLKMVDTPLVHLPIEELRPTKQQWDELMGSY